MQNSCVILSDGMVERRKNGNKKINATVALETLLFNVPCRSPYHRILIVPLVATRTVPDSRSKKLWRTRGNSRRPTDES